ncbi:hypothetical protein RBSH_00381 [Rhodopirellula baltica SH28]|uniref:Uncharacterized protein n=1 Tax=Rhodopirellula baltica SH28 TaxID=993517 RepID=K5DN93_RHOBT|nr:hypothetical protein RBSH_00381 [Rhodopirellula baltica SH28]
MPKARGFRGLLFKLTGKTMMYQHSVVGTSNEPTRNVHGSTGE